jgi:hypothetical protein
MNNVQTLPAQHKLKLAWPNMCSLHEDYYPQHIPVGVKVKKGKKISKLKKNEYR